jgi:hypothetical protein
MFFGILHCIFLVRVMTHEDKAFDEIARKQGHSGGGFQAKRAAAADKFIAAEERKVGERYGYVPKLHPSEWMNAQPAQDPEMLTIVYQSGYHDGKQAALAGREWNFCERCGKRTKDLTVIHTCTPPQEKNL